jgi:hypothetical protein
MSTVGLYFWHIHHDQLVEQADEPITQRREYILRHKPLAEQDTRLRLLRRVRDQVLVTRLVEAYDDARATASRALDDATATASKAYDDATATARKAYDDATVPFFKAYVDAMAPVRKAYDDATAPARKAYDDARAPALKALEALHATECPDCPWNGETIFPEASN